MATRRSMCVTGVLLLAMAASASAQTPPTTISTRDQLSVSVWNAGASEEMFTGKYLVDADGAFEYPTFGRIKAAGMTTRELEAALTGLLGKYLVSPQVTVGLEQTSTRKVVINGEVRSPGVITFAGPMTLFEALTRAGSVTEGAAEDAIVHRSVTGPDGQVRLESIRVDVYGLLSGTSLEGNIALLDGDNIIVPKAQPIFVYGEVQQQGEIPARRGMTVQQAVALAGGLTDRGSNRSIRIQRVVDNKKVEIEVKDFTKDLVVAGDTITVRARLF